MKKILVVDDSLMDRKLLMRVITKAELPNEILQAENGLQAIEIVKQHGDDIGVVLLDYQMPIKNGIDFLNDLVADNTIAHIPIVMVTASSSEESKQAAYDANPNLAGYVIKPYKPDDILNLVKPAL